MSRPREFDEETALRDGMMAFWSHGYHATGVQQLVHATGMNRASLYNTFASKEQFFLSALKRYTEICLENLQAALDSGSTPTDGILKMLNYFMENLLNTARGCLLYNTALEVSKQESSIRGEVQAGMESIESMLITWIGDAQQSGDVGAGADPVLLARIAMAAMHSMTVRSGCGASEAVLSSIRDGAMMSVQCVADR